MKKSLKTIALVLALTLALCTTAFAAGGGYEVTGDNVVFATDSTLNVSFTNDAIQDGRDYMIWVIAENDAGMYVPTQSSILYIGQGTAEGNTFTFSGIYPKEITNSAVMISGPGISNLDEAGLYTLGIIKAAYKPGDPDMDGYITASDAAMTLRIVAGIDKNATESELQAADADQDGHVTAADAALILRCVAGIDTL